MEITASLVRDLREASGAGMMDCKKALNACDGDLDKAMDYLRENGIAKAEKKSGRIAAEGLAQVFVEGNKAVILEVNSETDFVSKNEEFTEMIQTIGSTVLKSDVQDLESALKIQLEEGLIKTINYFKHFIIGIIKSLVRQRRLVRNFL